jgi:Putative Flp pilus-assembly TadE/G-like
MDNLFRCRRGSAAFATVVALVPLVGVVALGGEAASWYVTKQHAQDAADAAAYSGAVQQACLMASPCGVTQTVDYRAQQSAAQNAFCNAGGTSYPGSRCVASLPTGISQSVQITSLTSWNGARGNFVQATVSQQQPAHLAKVLGLSTVNIGATAIAKVVGLPKPPCALALTGSISFQGSPNINAPNCGIASNSTAQNALNFTGGGMTMNLGSLSTVGGCAGAASFCNTAFTHMPAPIVNPFSALDGALTTLCGANPTLPATCGLTNCNTSSGLVAYTATTKCTNNGFSTKGNTAYTLAAGVYFISGTLTLKGGSSLNGAAGVTFILLPGATIDTRGGGTLTIKAPTTAPSASSLPTALQSGASLFQYMAMYDASAAAVQFGGNSNINLTGNIYAPKAAVTFQGNPTISSCGELVAASIAFNGNATFDSTGCSSATKLPSSQYVQLVQ